MTLPLQDIVIVEIDSYMAAPSAGAILADLGATVIKIEPLSGDPMRGMSRPLKGEDFDEATRDYDFGFDVDNRGKKSVAVALDQPAGADLVRSLVAKADIFMCNLLVNRQEKFGLDPNSLFTVQPNLVHATLTGYGTTGPDAWRPGYDVTAFFGRSGLYDAQREGDAGIVPMARPAQGDHTTGLAMVGAILAALRLAEKSGEPQVVETSLYETAVWTQATDYAVTAIDHAPVRRRARHEMLAITANRFPCGDGKWVVFNMMPDAVYWSRLCEAIDVEHLIEDPRFIDSRSRYRNMAALIELIDAALSLKSRDQWGKLFDKAGLIWGPVLGLHEVPQDPHAQAIGLFPTVAHPDIGEYQTVNIPMRFATADVKPQGPAPLLGQHTKDVLSNHGLSEQDIQSLLDSGTIGLGNSR
ncbi:MAG: CoA transferase [Gammaproteobacteria bacterium]|jgi:crotonobetainyl-CoA:carnitine CoA-transferase CaiB-like acyl-CoA transferase|nr:CoA transferase [Gammaproteobacteria bacterium]